MSKVDAKNSKLLKAVAFCGLIFILSGISFVVIDRYVFPKLIANEWLAKYKIFKKAAENVVVVNKTEQVTVSEDRTVSRYSNKSASSVVEILSRKRELKISNAIFPQDTKIGSGVIVTAEGLVATHKNALAGENPDCQVITGSGEKLGARVVLSDSFSDMALLKIDGAENLPTASFIAPEDIKVGAKVVAIGRNGNNAQTVFKSGLLNRFAADFSIGGPIASSEKLQGVYFANFEMADEGDANLVGSAIADYNGDVVGILGARKSGSSEQYFAIPVSYVDGLVKQFIEKGVVQRGTLGVYYLPLTGENSVQLADGREISRGALVYTPSGQQGLAVIAGSPADKAGIKVMDVIASVNGEEVNLEQNLAYLISKYKPGDEITLKILREGREMEMKVILQ